MSIIELNGGWGRIDVGWRDLVVLRSFMMMFTRWSNIRRHIFTLCSKLRESLRATQNALAVRG